MNRPPFLISAAVFALFAGQAHAQDSGRQILPGETLRGELGAGDQRRGDDDSYFDVFQLRLDAGQAYAVTLRSMDFDAYLTIKGPAGFDQSDDDGAGGDSTDAQIRFTAPASGVYEIRANSYSRATGAYTLQVAEIASPSAGSRAIQFGETLRGSITASSPLLDDQTPYEPFVFDGEAGQRIAIDMTAEDFDSYLILRREGSDVELKSNDDGGEGFNARLIYTLPSTGRYQILANTVIASARGDFTVSLNEAEGSGAQAMVTDIAYGQIVRGALSDDDAIDTDQLYYDVYKFTGRAGDHIVISASSSDFDTHLFLRKVGSEAWLADDDDGGEQPTDSKIVFTLPSGGDFEIHVVSVEAEQTGDYTLVLSLGR